MQGVFLPLALALAIRKPLKWLGVGCLRDKCKLNASIFDMVFAVSVALPRKMSGFTSPCLSWPDKVCSHPCVTVCLDKVNRL